MIGKVLMVHLVLLCWLGVSNTFDRTSKVSDKLCPISVNNRYRLQTRCLVTGSLGWHAAARAGLGASHR